MNTPDSVQSFRYDVVVVGLGYVGIPVLNACTLVGLRTLGFDTSDEKIKKLKSDADLGRHNFTPSDFTSDPKLLREAKVVCVCVPTPLDSSKIPDLGAVVGAAINIGTNLRRGQLVILESTTFPGTTEGVFKETLEHHSNLVAGIDFDLAYSPERIDPGNEHYSLWNTPKVVGAINDISLNRATTFYSKIVNVVVPSKSLKAAEASKILENTYRHINISFINEFAMACSSLDIDVFEVIELAASKPFGFQKFTPGPGSGGHCIPVDPNYFLHALKEIGDSNGNFIELATQTNHDVANFISRKLRAKLWNRNKNSGEACILVLGLAYKADSDDTRESPTERILPLLQTWAKSVLLHDPFVDGAPIWGFNETIKNSNLEKEIHAADLILITQPHKEYLQLAEQLEPHSQKTYTTFNRPGFPGQTVFTHEI